MHAAICDDESLFLEQLHEIILKTNRIDKCDLFDSIDDLRIALRKGIVYDVIFMDIDWKKENENGMLYASEINKLHPETLIIYTTAYNEKFSQEIFWESVNLCGYLVKPVQSGNLQKLLDKIEKQQNSEKSIILKQNGTFNVLPYKQILYLESRAHQIFIYTTDGEFAVYEKLDTYEDKLKNSFVRTHQSYLVNMEYIKRIDKKDLQLQDDTILPVSKSKYISARNKYFAFIRSQI